MSETLIIDEIKIDHLQSGHFFISNNYREKVNHDYHRFLSLIYINNLANTNFDCLKKKCEKVV